MITGTVTTNREIVVSLEVLGPGQVPMPLQGVVDTGFNGYLTLPLSILRNLNAIAFGTRTVELGDGQVTELDVFCIHVAWHGASREVLALHAEATPLIGMSLLWGSRVQFDCQENGVVTIDEVHSH